MKPFSFDRSPLNSFLTYFYEVLFLQCLLGYVTPSIKPSLWTNSLHFLLSQSRSCLSQILSCCLSAIQTVSLAPVLPVLHLERWFSWSDLWPPSASTLWASFTDDPSSFQALAQNPTSKHYGFVSCSSLCITFIFTCILNIYPYWNIYFILFFFLLRSAAKEVGPSILKRSSLSMYQTLLLELRATNLAF